jgi:hypothetical protein
MNSSSWSIVELINEKKENDRLQYKNTLATQNESATLGQENIPMTAIADSVLLRCVS